LKIARIPIALSLALFAALPVIAAAVPPSGKPVAAGEADSDRDAWRGRAVAMCVSDLSSLEGVTPDEREATCGCTIDRFMAGKRTDDLPAFSPRDYRMTIGSALLSCASTQRIAVVTAVARHLADAPMVREPPAPVVADGKPTDAQDQGSAATRPDRPLPDFGTWLSSLSLPDWVTNSGLPSWAWAILATIAFLVLRGLRRGGDQSDQIGPPPSTRFGAKANTPTPRRPDPPQRG
jgi:hypothetical protein